MTISEKVAYIQGLFDGLKLDTEKSGEARILSEVLDVLREVGQQLDSVDAAMDQFDEELDTLENTVADLEEAGVIVKAEGKTRAISLPGFVRGPIAEEEHSRANQIPVLGNVAAGAPILAQEHIEEYLTFDTQGLSGEHFALKVRGESMLDAGILPEDLVVVHRQQQVRSGDIVVALFEDEATVKTFRRQKGHVWLIPENPDYQPIDGTRAEIIGKVVAVIRRY